MATTNPTITKEQLHQYLKKVGWPMAPIVIAQFAKENGAPPEVLQAISRTPNQIYMSEGDFWEEFRKVY